MKDVIPKLPSVSQIDKALNDGRAEDLMRQVFINRKPRAAKPNAHKSAKHSDKIA